MLVVLIEVVVSEESGEPECPEPLVLDCDDPAGVPLDDPRIQAWLAEAQGACVQAQSAASRDKNASFVRALRA